MSCDSSLYVYFMIHLCCVLSILCVCVVCVCVCVVCVCVFFFQAEDGIRDLVRSRGLGDVYKRQVIENATGLSLNTYVNQKLKIPTGMNGAFITSGYNNVFISTPRSMARFGLLILNRGNWNGTAIMTDSVYFNAMTNSSQALNDSYGCLLYTSPSPRDRTRSRMPSSA